MAKLGICRLCGRYGPLSFEHVPPKAAFNHAPVLRRSFEDWIIDDPDDSQPAKGRVQQRGVGAFTLCERCNNRTGTWYGHEYVRWARAVAPSVWMRPTELCEKVLSLTGVRPLRFLKQCITCLFSVNPPEFGATHPYLREFVLDKSRTGLPPEYDVYLTLVTGPATRGIGVSAMATIPRDFKTRRITVLTEYAHAPFAVTLTLNSPFENDVGRISHFSLYGYDQTTDIHQPVRQGQVYSTLPWDFRSKREMNRDFVRNKLEAIGLTPIS